MIAYGRPIASVTAALKRQRAWLAKATYTRTPRPADVDRQADIIAACVTILRQSPAQYASWMRRKNRLKLIREAPQRFGHAKTVKAILELIDLAISDLESWPKSDGNGGVRTVFPGALNVPAPRTLSQEHIEKLRAGRANARRLLRPRDRRNGNQARIGDQEGRFQAPQIPKKQGSTKAAQ